MYGSAAFAASQPAQRDIAAACQPADDASTHFKKKQEASEEGESS